MGYTETHHIPVLLKTVLKQCHNAMANFCDTRIDYLYGYMYAIGSGLAGVIAAACCQALHGEVPGYELAAVRFCHFCTIVITRAYIKGNDLRIEPRYAPWIFLITAMTVLWNIFFYMAAVDIPLGTLMTAYTSLTYLEMIILARIFLKQRFIWSHFILALAVLSGNLLLVQPNPPFATKPRLPNATWFDTDSPSFRTPLELTTYIPMLLASALASSGGIIFKCQLSPVPLFTSSVWIAVSGLFTTTGLTMYLTAPVFVNGPENVLILIGHGTGAACNTVLLQHAQKKLSPDKIAGLDVFTKCLIAFALQYGVVEFASGYMNLYELAGTATVLLGLLLSVIAVLKSKYTWYQQEKPLHVDFDFDW